MGMRPPGPRLSISCCEQAKSLIQGEVGVLGLEADADEAAGEVLESGDAGEDAQGERWFHGALVVEGFVRDAVSDDLDALGASDSLDAALLDPLEVVIGEGVGAEWFGEDLGKAVGESVEGGARVASGQRAAEHLHYMLCIEQGIDEAVEACACGRE